MPLPPYLYPYDPVGTSPDNKVTNELHNVAPPNNILNANFIVPRAAPFYKEGLIVRTGTSTNSPELIEGVDYILTHPFIEASVSINKLLYGSIMFLDREYSGNIYLTYQLIGAGYTLDDYSIVESLTNSLYNIRLVSWTQIEGLPLSYPGLPHTHTDYSDMVGLSAVVDKLTQLVTAVNASGGNLNTLITSFQVHLNAPLSHSKSQVGLSNLPNYPVATPHDLSTRSNTALMTPFQTLKMLTMYGGASDGNGDVLTDTLDIDLATQPGRYLLPRSMVIHAVNTGKLPFVIIDKGNGVPDEHYGALLEVINVHNDKNDRMGLIQRITHTPFFIHDNQMWERRKVVASTGGVWLPWYSVNANRNVVATCDFKADDDIIQITNGVNIISNLTPATAPAGGYQRSGAGTTFSGNYNSDAPPLNYIYTVNFVENMTDVDYHVQATLSPFATGGLNGVYQFVLIDRQLDGFSFGVVGLTNYSNGSTATMQRKFKANIAVIANRTLTRVT